MRLGADVVSDADGGECVESTFLVARDLSTLYGTTLQVSRVMSRLLNDHGSKENMNIDLLYLFNLTTG